MPITFSVANHSANAVKLDSRMQEGVTADQIFVGAAGKTKLLLFGIVGTEASGRDFSYKITRLVGENNGFVDTVIQAYNDHHALVIRPDDVWLTILCQFNYFVNANAELLRASFVAHEGKKELLIEGEGNINTLNFGKMARQMVGLLDKNVSDPTLRTWALPTFTTTTVNDTTAAAVLLMATLKKYFSYGFGGLACGIPRVTLEGEKADWVDILGRLEKLKEYSIKTIAWYHLLCPAIRRFVAAFDAPDSEENVDFWGKVAHYHRGGSGPSYYSGWINAFNVFSEQGVWLGPRLNITTTSSDAPESMSAETFWAVYGDPKIRKDLVFDGTPYHLLNAGKVPRGCAEVDVVFDDNGKKFDCSMGAGMIGMQVSSSGDTGLSEGGKDDTVRPVAGWWMVTKLDGAT